MNGKEIEGEEEIVPAKPPDKKRKELPARQASRVLRESAFSKYIRDPVV